MKTEIIPVIHMLNEEQVFKNVDTCLECGIKKVFIINHNVSVGDLLNCAKQVKLKYPELWVGVNLLGVDTYYKTTCDFSNINAIWCDETLNGEQYSLFKKSALTVFGGLAFKYQIQPLDLLFASKHATISTDVATTSGSATGKSPTIFKINKIREYLDEHPMAIASGVSVDNILNYKGIVNYLLVASSITHYTEIIVKEKLSELIYKLN